MRQLSKSAAIRELTRLAELPEEVLEDEIRNMPYDKTLRLIDIFPEFIEQTSGTRFEFEYAPSRLWNILVAGIYAEL